MLAFLVATMHVEHSTRNLAVLDASAKRYVGQIATRFIAVKQNALEAAETNE